VSCLLERRRFYNEVLLSDLIALYQNTGLVVWGQIQGFPGTYQKLLVQADGTVVVTGTATVSGSVDVTDRSSRLLGIVYGSQNQQLLQRALTYDLLVTLRQSGAELSTSNPLFTGIVDASGNRMPSMDVSTRPGYVDVIDRAARLLGVPYGSQAQPLQQKATTYELLTDVIDRANRQLGYIYGSQNQTLQQKATTYELLVDVVDRAARLVGVVYGSQGQQLLQRASTYDLLVTLRQGGSELSTSNPVFAGIVDASGNRLPSMDTAARRGYVTITDGTNTMPTMDTSGRPGYVDMIDRAARLLGHVTVDSLPSISGSVDITDRAARLLGITYGSQSQQLQQRASTYDLIVQLRTAGVEYDARQIRALTSGDVVSAVQSGAWNIGTANVESTNNSSTATLGANGVFTGTADDLQNYVALIVMIYADQASAASGASVQFSEDSTHWDYLETFTVAAGVTRSQIFTRHARYVRMVYTNGATPQGAFRLQTSLLAVAPSPFALALTSSPNTDEHIPLNRSFLVGQYGSAFYNASVSPSGQLFTLAYGSQGQQLQQKATTYELLVDVVDRAARLLGVVYGSQGQQLLQRASTYDLLVTLRQGGSELSTSNPVFAGIVDASGNRLPSMDVAARRGYVTVTDGTNTMPTMDTSTRAGYIDVVDRAGRLLGVVYGSQGQQIQQKATTYELLTDPVDRAARLLGVVYGSQGQQLLQRATTYDLIVQLRSGGSEINPQTIRALTTSDQITPIQTTRTNLTVKPEREDLTSYAALISPNGAGVQLIAGSGSLKIKVKKWGYQSTVAGQHFFYFGTSTTAPTLSATPTAKVFGVQFTAGTYRQTSTDPDVGAAGDGLYFYSANAESNMTVEWQSVQETP